MTPSLFDLPLRLGDAVALSTLVFEFADGRPVNDEVRNRIGGRAAGMKFGALRPYPASLERDPIHPSAYYCCVDGIDGQPLLLRIALAAAPSSGLFPKAILIGRTHVGKKELVLNVVPFGPGDHARIKTFSEELNRNFLPKTYGLKPVVRVSGDSPATLFPFAAEGFRTALKASGQNLACFAALPGTDLPRFYFDTVWSMIRAGWREGYVLQAEPVDSKGVRVWAPLFTRFALRDAALLPAIRDARRHSFDVELITTAQGMDSGLELMRVEGSPAQSVRLEPLPEDLSEAETVAQRSRAQINRRDIHLKESLDRQGILDAFEGI